MHALLLNVMTIAITPTYRRSIRKLLQFRSLSDYKNLVRYGNDMMKNILLQFSESRRRVPTMFKSGSSNGS